jgi:hypothetical protein
MACSKIEYRKLTTLRIVLGDRPSASIALATASTGAVVMLVTASAPRRGEMWTRCIDSQPSK